VSYAWFIPVLPVLSFLILTFFGKKMPKISAYIAIACVGVSLILSYLAFFTVLGNKTFHQAFEWFAVGSFKVGIGVTVDALSSLMLIVVTTVSMLVQIYSIGYMHGEKRYSWYYAVISLFTAAMLALVLADNFILFYASWELMGLCSYLLIGYWYEKPEAASAAKKAFIVTRIGDIGLLVGIILLYVTKGSFDFSAVFAGHLATGIATVSALLLFCGAAGKSAQFPLHVWLPYAMEGPTPVSALIHAATMVAAGVYLIARTYPVFHASPTALYVVAIIGTISAFGAALVAVVQTDIKRILAYCTISQLGYMMIGLGVGSLTAGIFHLMTHAFFKALLFLGSGSVIHACHTNNIFEMGGLSKKMKVTTWTFIIASLAVAGVPGLAGFFSKDEVIAATFKEGHYVIFVFALLTAFLTAFYMFRLCFVTFFGQARSKAAKKAHESPSSMTIPLLILTVPSIAAGWVFLSFGNFIFYEHHHPFELNLPVMLASIFMGLLGIFMAWGMYYKGWMSDQEFSKKMGSVHTLLDSKYYIDAAYSFLAHTVIVGGLSAGFAWFDRKIVNRGIDSIAGFFKWCGDETRLSQTGQLNAYAIVMLGSLVLIMIYLLTSIL
jgi:NADH-quinone oxidoreductase subunit L